MGLFDGSIGPFVIGTVLACYLSGITSAQAFQYSQNFPNDRRLYKSLVVGLFVLDMLHSAVAIVTIWNWCVENYGDVSNLVIAPWSFGVDPALVGIISFACQIFFCYRVYILSKRQWVIPSVVLILSTLSLAFAIGSTYQIFHLKRFDRFQSFTYGVATWLSASAAADILITCSLVFYLSKSKEGGIKTTNSILNRLIELTVSTNGITCSVAILDAILFGSRSDSSHVAPNLILPKLYYTSLLVSLNARVALERKLISSNGGHADSIGLGPVSTNVDASNQARRIKTRFEGPASPTRGGVSNGIHVTSHIVHHDEALSSTYIPSETTSDKELPFYSTEKETESRNDPRRVSPFKYADESDRV
ncbi:hypothetical protein JCM11491_003007 [Sporobolomyces phaffii]